jgi:hypothetical protein
MSDLCLKQKRNLIKTAFFFYFFCISFCAVIVEIFCRKHKDGKSKVGNVARERQHNVTLRKHKPFIQKISDKEGSFSKCESPALDVITQQGSRKGERDTPRDLGK